MTDIPQAAINAAAEAIHHEGPPEARTCSCQSADEHDKFMHDDMAAAIRALDAAAPHIAAMTPEQMLREFHSSKAVHGGLMPERPTADIPDWVRDLRMALLDEEVEELREVVQAGDIVKIADALGDIEFVTRGTAVAYGIPSDAVLAEVFRSNMTKVNTPAEAKLVKGPGYEPPRIADLLGKDGT